MNLSSLNIDFSTMHRQKDIYKYAGSEQFVDEATTGTKLSS